MVQESDYTEVADHARQIEDLQIWETLYEYFSALADGVYGWEVLSGHVRNLTNSYGHQRVFDALLDFKGTQFEFEAGQLFYTFPWEGIQLANRRLRQ